MDLFFLEHVERKADGAVVVVVGRGLGREIHGPWGGEYGWGTGDAGWGTDEEGGTGEEGTTVEG